MAWRIVPRRTSSSPPSAARPPRNAESVISSLTKATTLRPTDNGCADACDTAIRTTLLPRSCALLRSWATLSPLTAALRRCRRRRNFRAGLRRQRRPMSRVETGYRVRRHHAHAAVVARPRYEVIWIDQHGAQVFLIRGQSRGRQAPRVRTLHRVVVARSEQQQNCAAGKHAHPALAGAR